MTAEKIFLMAMCMNIMSFGLLFLSLQANANAREGIEDTIKLMDKMYRLYTEAVEHD